MFLVVAREAGLSIIPRLKLRAQTNVPQHSGPDVDSMYPQATWVELACVLRLHSVPSAVTFTAN